MATELQRQTPQELSRAERTRSRPVLVPPVDIYESNEEIVVLADMPGIDDKNLDITLEQDVLTIEGPLAEPERPGHALAMAEYQVGDYRRVFTLSTEVEREKISAEVKDGVLKLTLPKAEPAKAKKITVKAT